MDRLRELIDKFEHTVNEKKERELEKRCKALLTEIDIKVAQDREVLAGIERLISDQNKAINQIMLSNINQPWLCKAIADFRQELDFDVSSYLRSKKNPARTSAENNKLIAKEKRELLVKLKEAEYKIAYYEGLFPELENIIEEVDEDSDDIIEDGDEVLGYISKVDYNKLSVTDRNQMALDNYLKKNHSKKHIGKMYERYVGYLYEKEGYEVEYCGIKNGLNDLGRDLICVGNGEIHIVQCKCWSSVKTIHENIICQLYGTSIKYMLDHNIAIRSKNLLFGDTVVPVFVTNIDLSSTAKTFAKSLGVEIKQIPLSKDYPMIKCNINANNKIYHLPFDQMYDLAQIKNKGECYVSKVIDAEKLGFRRAYRHIVKNN